MSAFPFTLRATLTDGFTVDLDGRYATEALAARAASSYARRYADPCGLCVRVAYVSILDTRLAEVAR